MQGQLSQHPLVEIIREIIATEWSGALRLTQDRVKLVLYFDRGELVYAISNLKQYRLAESLRRAGSVTEEQLEVALAASAPDAKLAQSLLQEGIIDRTILNQVITWQANEILKFVLPWTSGDWELQARVRPVEKATINLPLPSLLMEAARKLPPEIIKKRFSLEEDQFEPANFDLQNAPLLPNEAFVMTRVYNHTSLHDLLSLSGLPETTALQAVYSLSLGGYLKRESWPTAFTIELPQPEVGASPEPSPDNSPQLDETARVKRELESYLARMEDAQNFYQMIGVENDVDSGKLKVNYYNIARKFHPDLYRNAETSVRSRIEAEFSRVTRAYETLKDEKLRATYDSKLLAGNNRGTTTNAKPPPPPTQPIQAPPQVPPIPATVGTQPRISQPQARIQSPPPFRKAEARPAAADANPTSPFMARDDNRRDAFNMPLLATETPKKVDALMQKRASEQFQRGVTALASRDHVAAIACLAEATRLDPGKARHHAYFGRALSGNSGARRQAESELNEAIRLEPSNLDYQVMLAEFFWNAGFPLRCQGEIKRILEKNPYHPEARALRDKLSADALKK